MTGETIPRDRDPALSDNVRRVLAAGARLLRAARVDLLVADEAMAAPGDDPRADHVRDWLAGGAEPARASRVVGARRLDLAVVRSGPPPLVLVVDRDARRPRPAGQEQQLATLAALVDGLLAEPDGAATPVVLLPADTDDWDASLATDDRDAAGRRELALALEASRDACSAATVLVIGIDRLAVVNEVLGREAGTLFLQTTQRRAGEWAGPDAVVVRLSGSRFGIVHPQLQDPDAALAATARLRDVLAEPVEVAGLALSRSVSIGLAIAGADGPAGEVAERTVAHAVLSLDAARRAGGDAVRTHEPGADAERAERAGRLRLELELDAALRAGELRLHYQPEFDLRTGELLAVEALLRWAHPRLGLVRADAFVDGTERTRTFAAVQLWVVDEACRQLASWRQYPGGAELGLRVNISAWQIERGELAEALFATLGRHGLAPQSLCVELTERQMPRELARIAAPLERLSDAGVSIAVDDFGTGQATISALLALPIDTVKIDRTFVAAMREDPRAEAVVAGVIALAGSLSLETVAEGVDGADTAARLIRLGCGRGQGNSLGAAMPAGELEQFLRG